MRKINFPILAAGVLVGAPLTIVMEATSAPAAAQPVVQPLPSPAVADLNSALGRLARDSRDVNALIQAGDAALSLGDIEAAIGFYGRADELSPGNPRIKVGLAGAFVRSERPLEALRLFDEAEAAGASTLALAGDRGLAYDLVGDNANAQAHYRRALAQREDAEIRRRLSLSQAIAGDRAGFEATLLPLLQAGDRAAFRIRAFGLAALERTEEAVKIADTSMPAALAARIGPYLRYMPRLTKAQQAAAANLGIFPRAAQIGRDDPRIASYSGSPGARNADARLAPAGEALGPREDNRSGRRRPGRADSSLERAAAREERRERARAAQVERARSERAARVAAAAPRPVPPPPPPPPAPPPPPPPPPPAAPIVLPEAEPEPRRETAPAFVPPAEDAAPTVAQQPEPSFDLATVAAPPPPPPVASQVSEAASVQEAFAIFSALPADRTRPNPGAVDVSSIAIPREVPPAPPKKIVHPSRVWVQVATGRDVEALGFDWRRISRKAGELLAKRTPHVTPWGEANRLLAGPLDSAAEARKLVTALKEAEIDSFVFTSPEGQEIQKLD